MKKTLCVLGVLLCLLWLPPQAFAASAQDYVTDSAGILSDSDRETLDSRAREVSETYGCGVYVRLVEDYMTISTGSVRQAAEDLYTSQGLGLGETKGGVLLLLSMADRDYALIAYGYGNTAFTDYGKDVLSDAFLDNFRYNDWAGGLRDYISTSETMLAAAARGEPVDVVTSGSIAERRSLGESLGGMSVLLVIAIGGGVALLVCEVQRRKLKSVHKATNAIYYSVPNSLNMRIATDLFSHLTQTRVEIVSSESNRTGGGGGGGTHISSSGFSGKSGKF